MEGINKNIEQKLKNVCDFYALTKKSYKNRLETLERWKW